MVSGEAIPFQTHAVKVRGDYSNIQRVQFVAISHSHRRLKKRKCRVIRERYPVSGRTRCKCAIHDGILAVRPGAIGLTAYSTMLAGGRMSYTQSPCSGKGLVLHALPVLQIWLCNRLDILCSQLSIGLLVGVRVLHCKEGIVIAPHICRGIVEELDRGSVKRLVHPSFKHRPGRGYHRRQTRMTIPAITFRPFELIATSAATFTHIGLASLPYKIEYTARKTERAGGFRVSGVPNGPAPSLLRRTPQICGHHQSPVRHLFLLSLMQRENSCHHENYRYSLFRPP